MNTTRWIIIVLLLLTFVANAQKCFTVTATRPRTIIIGDQLENKTFYTGVNDYFVFSFANDSIVQARFFGIDGFAHYQEIRYYSKGDTIILNNSSQVRLPCSMCSQQNAKYEEPSKGIPVIVKFFSSLQLDKVGLQERQLLHEGIFYMDSISRQIYIPYKEGYCRYADIIIVNYNSHYVRLCKDIDTSYSGLDSKDYLKIDLSNIYSTCHTALFNNFPLVIKGDSIIPIDSEKNYQCWVDNGFFFPIMTKSSDEPWKANDITYWRVGLEGTKFEY